MMIKALVTRRGGFILHLLITIMIYNPYYKQSQDNAKKYEEILD